jgi:hemolysin III
MNIIHKELELFTKITPYYYINGSSRPKYRGLSHLISFYIIPYLFIYNQYQNVDNLLGILLSYLIMSGMLILFGVSSHYHRWNIENKEQHDLLCRLDHCSINYFIACGMYPFCFLLIKKYILQGYLFLGLNSIMLILNLIYNMTKQIKEIQDLTSIILSSLQPVTMFPFLYYIIPLLSNKEIIYISCKYIVQFIGLIIYKYKLFDYHKDIFGYHEIFHLFTIAGTIISFSFLSTICNKM